MNEDLAKSVNMSTGGSDTGHGPDSPTSLPGYKSKSLPASSAKYTRGEMATLVIGPDKHELAAYGHLLAKDSEFFEAALKKEWKEGQTRIINLPEEDIETVTHYLDFVHGQGLPTAAIMVWDELATSPHGYPALFELYLLGERVLDKAARNAIVTEIMRLIWVRNDNGDTWVPNHEAISFVYGATPESSPARRLLVDLHVKYGLPEFMDHGTYDPICLTDLVKAFTDLVKDTQGTCGTRYDYLEAENNFV